MPFQSTYSDPGLRVALADTITWNFSDHITQTINLAAGLTNFYFVHAFETPGIFYYRDTV